MSPLTPRPVTLTTALVAAALACSAAPAVAATAEPVGSLPTARPTATDRPTSTTTTAPTATPTARSTTTDDATTEMDAEPTSEPGTDQPTEQGTESGAWLSGASGDGAADGDLGAWRGDPVDIVGTWADQGDNQTELYSIAPGGEVADFDGAIDIAPGGLQDGDTWAAAADGAYDDRWRESLTRMAELRADRGTTYIRPFHEFNLGGWDWSVSPDDAEDFKAAWARYRAIQQQVFPEARLVYGVNVTSSGTDLDWRTTWPGYGQADVLGVDTYNGWPTITSEGDFQAQLDARGDDGIPVGLDAYSEQAEQWGVPLAVPEWSGRAEMGDEPAYVEGMTDWFAENAGDGPGQLEYEILFNAPQDDGNFQLYADDSRMPQSAQAYVEATEATAEQRQDAPEEIEGGQGPTTAPTTEPSPTSSATSRRTSSGDLDERTNAPSSTATSSPSSTRTADDQDDDGEQVNQRDVDDLLQRLDALLSRLDQQ